MNEINTTADRIRTIRLRGAKMTDAEYWEMVGLQTALNDLWYHRRRCRGAFCCGTGYLAGTLPRIRMLLRKS